MKPVGIYIHIPFCRSKCDYCDFYSITDENIKKLYITHLIKEINTYKDKGIVADTLFIGGGTPSLLSEDEVSLILLTVKDVFSLDGEITMEANPDSVSEDYLEKIFKLGINRISFGAQSAVDEELSALGRRHNSMQIKQAVTSAKKAGFKNISLDIMLGIPYQTKKSLIKTLEFMTSLNPDHLSCYLLKIEEGTAFYKNHMEKFCADEDKTADFYLKTVEFLEKKGYLQYEISNFCKKGFESRHNLKYWLCEEYLGFGCAAHSFYEGNRFYHSRSIQKYISSSSFSISHDGKGGDIKERILLKLRLSKGIDLSLLDTSISEKILANSTPFIERNLMKLKDTTLSFTPEGFLISNMILLEILNF